MAETQGTTGRSTVVGVFRDPQQAERAVEQLKHAGFRDQQIGFAYKGDGGESGAGGRGGTDVTTDTGPGSGAARGAVSGGVLGALAGAAASLLIPGIGPVLAGGILATALGGAAIGAAGGGILGGLLTTGVREDEARYYDEQFRQGRVLVTVQANGRAQEAERVLRSAGAYDFSTSGPTASAGGAATRGVERRGGELRVPEVEERLEVEKRPVQLGEVEVRKTAEEQQQTVPVDLQREEVQVERRDVPERPLRPGEAPDAFKQQTIRVPVRGEEAVARREPVVTGEVVIDKEPTTERQEVAGTVRRERVEVDDSPARTGAGAVRWEDAAPRFRTHWQQRYGSTGGRFEECEPAYRYGFEMRNDPRYRGRRWEEVEADLQKDWAQRQPGMSWDKIRAYVREAWTDLTA